MQECLLSWTVDQTLSLADEVHQSLAADDDNAFLRQMYGDEPLRWSDDLTGNDRLRCVVNGLTRLRVVSSDGTMNLKHKDNTAKAPHGFMPWFRSSATRHARHLVVFGHWSAEGWSHGPNAIGILDLVARGAASSPHCGLLDREFFQRDCSVSQVTEAYQL